MDTYVIFNDLTIKWTKYQAGTPVNKQPLYHVNVGVDETKIDTVLGYDQSPHYYQILDAEKKPCEIEEGNFRFDGSKFEEIPEGINRKLTVNILDKNGDAEARSFVFSGVHQGDFVHKIPELINMLKEFNKFGSFSEMNELKKLETENAALKTTIDKLQKEVAQKDQQIDALQKEVEQLKANMPTPPSIDVPPPPSM